MERGGRICHSILCRTWPIGGADEERTLQIKNTNRVHAGFSLAAAVKGGEGSVHSSFPLAKVLSRVNVRDPRKGRRGGDESLRECVSPPPPGTTRFRPYTCGRMTGGVGAKDAGNCSFSCAQAVRQPWLCYIEMSLMLFLSVGLSLSLLFSKDEV